MSLIRVIDADNLGICQHLTNFKFSARIHAQSQEAVIWGCRDFSPVPWIPDNLTIKRTYLGSLPSGYFHSRRTPDRRVVVFQSPAILLV